MELKVLDINGNQTDKKIRFENNLFSNKSYDHSVYLEIKRYLSAQRQGNHKSKERGELSGSRRKLHRQKGTGGSRKGDIKNPIFRGGGRVFGPRPRKYLTKINKHTKDMVRKFIFEKKLTENKVKVVETMKLDIPKTKFIVKFLDSLQLKNEKSLMITGKSNRNLYLSSNNLKNFRLLDINELDCFSLLNFSYIILSEDCIEKVYKFLTIS
ncbi:50S ribosomal protein L4 [Blattabacterium cuenoti]|uniref:50S ribosomal protein L4 n=1 Tax=Blattabacterium cuenoti TaxID=1653831 RepID=UPI00163CE823|nr:50S ribosomal protein L4 [Blattabacterium cuenoti]